jgi:hypothetical protein
LGQGWVVYEAYEVKNKGKKLRCILLLRIFSKKNSVMKYLRSKNILNSADYTTKE